MGTAAAAAAPALPRDKPQEEGARCYCKAPQHTVEVVAVAVAFALPRGSPPPPPAPPAARSRQQQQQPRRGRPPPPPPPPHPCKVRASFRPKRPHLLCWQPNLRLFSGALPQALPPLHSRPPIVITTRILSPVRPRVRQANDCPPSLPNNNNNNNNNSSNRRHRYPRHRSCPSAPLSSFSIFARRRHPCTLQSYRRRLCRRPRPLPAWRVWLAWTTLRSHVTCRPSRAPRRRPPCCNSNYNKYNNPSSIPRGLPPGFRLRRRLKHLSLSPLTITTIISKRSINNPQRSHPPQRHAQRATWETRPPSSPATRTSPSPTPTRRTPAMAILMLLLSATRAWTMPKSSSCVYRTPRSRAARHHPRRPRAAAAQTST
ncbi:hypothetical protein DFJ73DRAFT_862072 [Zopfochytrium polystomum]|nr:hypothetical protein DFJ73DRAFT_862072 [Zopfochytrium polystomum]